LKTLKPKSLPDLTSEVGLGFLLSNDWVIIGVDEVGRGCLAGPVVAAAAALSVEQVSQLPFLSTGQRDTIKNESLALHISALWEVRDSKLIPEFDRSRIRDAVRDFVLSSAVAEASVTEINELNILYASHLAMERAVFEVESKIGRQADMVLVDGNMIPKRLRERGPSRVQAIVKGDSKSFTIACASILAKVYRDTLMESLESQFPGYGMAKHKGYPTPFHKAQIQELGATPIHRVGFKGVQLG
jgi:ribonuclease HII